MIRFGQAQILLFLQLRSILHCGEKVKFLDIDKTGNIDIKKLEKELIS